MKDADATMTVSFKANSVLVSEIQVSQDRVREDLGDIDSLMESIKRFGQFTPILITKNNELIAGFRRFTAIQRLGLSHINTVFYDEVDPLLFRQLELEENLQRKDMTWQEKVKAISGIDALRRQLQPTWSQEQTAIVAGVRQADVSNAIKIAKMMEIFPEIKEAKSFNQAASHAKHKAATVNRVLEVKADKQNFVDIESRILLGDSVDIIKSIPDEAFHAVITDPPFGIDYKSRKLNKAGVETAYEDDEDSYLRLLSMAPDLYRVIKPNGWLIWFFGMSWYQQCVDTFTDAGFHVDPLPIIWDRSEGRTFTNRPDRYMTRAYDVALHCRKGEPEMVVRGKPNIIKVAPVSVDERQLIIERPVELYAELIRRLTIPGEIVADFFVGSGACPAAAAATGREYFGVELNPERRVVALQKVRANTPA